MLPLLPLDLILTVGSSAAIFALGVMVWIRQRSATSGALFALMSICLAVWTSADWIVHLFPSAGLLQIILWKILFYAYASFGSAIAIHAAATIGHRPFLKHIGHMYLLSTMAFVVIACGLIQTVLGIGIFPTSMLLSFGAYLGSGLYLLAVCIVSAELYPILYVHHSSVLHRRHAAYGAIILIPFVIAGAMQFVIGPIPTGYFMPVAVVWFLIFSLLGSIRATVFGIELRPLEGFFILLVSFAVIILLRSRDVGEAIVAAGGSVLVGLFGIIAIHSVRSEQTRRRALEEANRELRSLEEAQRDFVDMVAHQLRGPIGGIRSAASMLTSGDCGVLPESAKHMSGMIQDSATRLLSLAETFLDASRMEVGRYESRPVAINVAEELEAVVQEMLNAAQTKHLHLTSAVAPNTPKNIVIDREALRQTLFNLVDNAIKYTESGGVHLECECEANYLICRVSDTGAGMSSKEISQLFRRFHRGAAGHSHAVDGTGLGLFIVKRLLEAVGGSISVTSEGPGKGTYFEMHLPYSLRNIHAQQEVDVSLT